MSDLALDADTSPQGSTAVDAAARKRPKPGERRVQILQALAGMLEQPGAERITTSALAAKLEVSEAALYRHFASKAQMFEGLIEFIEQSVFTLVNQIAEREPDPALRSRQVQREVLNIELADLQHTLMQIWRLPDLLVRITDDNHLGTAQARNVMLAIRVARHSALGWDNPALPDDVDAVADLLNLGVEPTWRLLRDIDGT